MAKGHIKPRMWFTKEGTIGIEERYAMRNPDEARHFSGRVYDDWQDKFDWHAFRQGSGEQYKVRINKGREVLLDWSFFQESLPEAVGNAFKLMRLKQREAQRKIG